MDETSDQDQKPKATSYAYGEAVQKQMMKYYELSKIVSDSNLEYLRTVLARKLVEDWALPRLSRKQKQETTVVDVGCSVGLFAIEFAKQGFRSFGIDFDPAAIRIARQLNEKENAHATFIQMDVSDWNVDLPLIDIAICFDVFEHLHDDEIGALLYALKKRFSPEGCIVFHTLPQQYDYLFWNGDKGIVEFPFLLRPFKNAAPNRFEKLVKIYALLRDVKSVYRTGLTYKEIIKAADHPNPSTAVRLADILNRAGYKILTIDAGFLGDVQPDPRHKRFFLKQPITYRSLFGVAIPK